MPFVLGGFAIILAQILCAVHCVRTGRNGGWLMVIIFLPLLGSLAYFVIEIMPGLGARREVQAAKTAAIRTLDPERGLRAAREALDTADTAANRIGVADALAELERWAEAVPFYQEGIDRSPAPERGPRMRLAKALYESKRDAEAKTVLEDLPPTRSNSERDRADLLMARVVEALGERERALALYRDVGERMPGGEAQCWEAALLIAMDRRGEARAPLEEVERRLKRIDPGERKRGRAMYDWAMDTLREMRAK